MHEMLVFLQYMTVFLQESRVLARNARTHASNVRIKMPHGFEFPGIAESGSGQRPRNCVAMLV